MATILIGSHAYTSLIGNLPQRAGSEPYRVRGKAELVAESGQFALQEINIHNSGSDASWQNTLSLANEQVTNSDPGRDYPEFTYHACIEPNGLLTVCHPIGTLTWHAGANPARLNDRKDAIGGNNWRGYGICLVGKFDAHEPSTAQLDTLRQFIPDLLLELLNMGVARPIGIVRHKDVWPPTACPGATSDDPNGWYGKVKGMVIGSGLSYQSVMDRLAEMTVRHNRLRNGIQKALGDDTKE